MSTTSKSTMPSVPTPAAARYIAAGDPRPPAPMHSTFAAFSVALPVHADFRQDQVPAVAPDFVAATAAAVRSALDWRRSLRPAGDVARPAGDRRDDAHRVARLERRLILLQIADVFVVDVDVDEAAQPAFVVEQMLLQPAEAAREIAEQLADGSRRRARRRRACRCNGRSGVGM